MDANPLIARMRHRWPLTESDFRDLRHLCRDVRALDRGDHIIGDGHRADRVHMIVSGWAARYKMLPDGGRQITALLLPGDLCNMRSTLLAATDQGIVALTPMQVAYILPDAIDAVEQASPRVSHALAWCSLVEQATLRAWIVNLGCRHALERVAHLLCELFERLSMTAVEGTGALFYPLTQGEIADTVGLTPVHVNRILQDLRGRGMITSTRGHLVVRDLFGLQRLAGFNGAYLRPEMAPMSELVS